MWHVPALGNAIKTLKRSILVTDAGIRLTFLTVWYVKWKLQLLISMVPRVWFIALVITTPEQFDRAGSTRTQTAAEYSVATCTYNYKQKEWLF